MPVWLHRSSSGLPGSARCWSSLQGTVVKPKGAEIVTTEMVVFEWLGTAEDFRLRNVIALVK